LVKKVIQMNDNKGKEIKRSTRYQGEEEKREKKT
jgi:hypothetical protein